MYRIPQQRVVAIWDTGRGYANALVEITYPDGVYYRRPSFANVAAAIAWFGRKAECSESGDKEETPF
jgi:hypothetical protein